MEIDFVIPWVDGTDEAWRAEKRKYQSAVTDDSNSANRFRDWGLMPFWFRAVEQFTPWVRKIHFITWGHIPAFLNTNHPKLHIVRHEDYIPQEFLPTFSANTIEMNMHRIPGLSENFVYFNDDMFLTRPMPETAFFTQGLPCAYGAEMPFGMIGRDGIWRHLIINDMRIVNNHFQKREQIKRYPRKYKNKVYGLKNNIRTELAQIMYPEYFLGFKNLHAPAAFFKSTFASLWQTEPILLQQTSSRRFRSAEDVNQWLAIWWQIADGKFSPGLIDNIVEDATDATTDALCEMIRNQTHDMLCINDPSDSADFAALSGKIQDAFTSILPNKSEYEK
jgi:hypothetical protein